MSKIKAGTTSGTALVTEGDTTGQLVFQTNGTTTALTLGTDQSATFVGNVAVNGTLTASSGLPSLASPLTVTGNSTAGAEIRLPEDTDNGSNYVALKAADSIASNLTFTLPSADGTNGQVLQTNGSGTLSFATPAAGALVFLSSQTVSGTPTVVSFTSGIGSTYDDYLIVYENVACSSTSTRSLAVRFQQSGSFQTGSVYSYTVTIGMSTTSDGLGAISQPTLLLEDTGISNDTGIRSGFLYLLNVNASGTARRAHIVANTTSRGDSALNSMTCTSGGTTTVTNQVSGIQFLWSTTTETFASGTFRLYGIAKS